MNLGEVMREAYATAVQSGFRDDAKSIPEDLCLVHSEVSEALESYRNGEDPYWTRETGKPEGAVAELADVCIRIAEMCQHHGWDLATAIRDKLQYNQSRSFKHGGKLI